MGDKIDREFFNVSLNLLSVTTLYVISTLPNPMKFTPTKENVPRDWRGLADLAGYNREDVSFFSCSGDPALSVLKKWSRQEKSSIKMFLLYLEKLDRFDIYDDIIPLIISDINKHKSNTRSNVDTSSFITLKDHEHYQKGLPPKQYDASILYADQDGEFATEIVRTLEMNYKLDIFMRERDLIGGAIEYDATMKIIANRSRRLIIIISPKFLESPENKYFISFAQSIGIEQRRRKIIPCIYKDCEIPFELKLLHKLYYKSGVLCNFYEKLYFSIIPAQMVVRDGSIPNSSISTPTMDSLPVSQIAPSTNIEYSSLPGLNEKVEVEKSEKTGSKITRFLGKNVFKKKKRKSAVTS